MDAARGYLLQAQIAANEKQETEPFFQKAVDANPRDYAAHLAIAIHYLGAGHDLAQAERHVRTAIEVNPDRVRGYRVLVSILASQNRIDEMMAVPSSRGSRSSRRPQSLFFGRQ